MRATMEKLWVEYASQECAIMDTEEERTLAKRALESYDAAKKTLSPSQRDAIERYVDALCELQGYAVRRAFLCGGELATLFLLPMCTEQREASRGAGQDAPPGEGET